MHLKDVTHPGGAAMRRRDSFLRHQWPAVVLSMLMLASMLLATPASADTGRPPAVVPTRDDTVLERLPRGYSKLLPAMPTGSATAPEALAEAERLYATAAETGDMRLSTRADALLARIPAGSANSQLLHAQAFGAQHRHDFDGAIALLDRAITLEPRDGDARLARAEVQMVSGRLGLARSDCIALTLGVDSGSGMLCIAALSFRRGDVKSAADLMDRWLAQSKTDDAERRFALVMRGEIASRAGDADADRWFTEALALARDDVRSLAAYVRHLRSRGRHAEIMALLKDAPDTDALHLQRALAAHALGLPEAASLVENQGRRYALARSVGTVPELRDEAEFVLVLKNDARAALALAQQNFRTQRDFEDVDLMQRTSAAAGQPDAMVPVRAWAAKETLTLPAPTTASVPMPGPAPAAAALPPPSHSPAPGDAPRSAGSRQ